jgi:hypothetical protein
MDDEKIAHKIEKLGITQKYRNSRGIANCNVLRNRILKESVKTKI